MAFSFIRFSLSLGLLLITPIASSKNTTIRHLSTTDSITHTSTIKPTTTTQHATAAGSAAAKNVYLQNVNNTRPGNTTNAGMMMQALSFSNSSSTNSSTPPAYEASCRPVQIGAKAPTGYVVIKGSRYAIAYEIDPNSMPPNRTGCCDREFHNIPDGWTIAENNDESRLVAKMFSFGADALVFKDGSAYLTVESAYPNRKESWNTITGDALSSQNGQVAVNYATAPNGKWGMPYSWCFRILLTQPAAANDANLLVVTTDRNISQYVTKGGKDFATLDDVDPALPWGSPNVSPRQTQAFVLPTNWSLASESEVQTLKVGIFSCGCLVGSTGNAFFNTEKKPCGSFTLLTHTTTEGQTVFWPNPRSGSIRILLVRATTPVKLNTADMKVLLLSPHSETTNAESAKQDSSLLYAKKIISNYGLEYENVAVVANGGRYQGDLLLYSTTVNGNVPHYHTIVLTSEALSYQRSDGQWESALAPQEWTDLRRYCSQFGVRLLSVYTFPGPRYGITEPVNSSTEGGFLWYHDQESWEMKENMVWHYPVSLNASIPDVKPWFYFTKTSDKPTGNDKVGGVMLNATSEHGEELHMFFASSIDVPHGSPVGSRVMEWATQNVEIVSDGSLSGGAIFGIVLAGVIVVGGIGFTLFYFRYRLCYRNTKENDRHVDDMAQWEYQQSGY